MALSKNRKSSLMWHYFRELDSTFACCNTCSAKLSYKTSTTNLKKHLKYKHPATLTEISSKDEARTVIDDNGLQYVDIEELVHDQGDKPSEEKLDNNKTSSTSSSRVLENKVHDILTKSGKKTEDESDVNSVVINLRVLDGNRHQQDEFYVFGEHIANELRHLKDPKYALVLAEVKQKINTILNEAEMHRLRLDSQQIPRPSTSIQMTYAIQIPVPSSHSNTVVTAVQTNDE